ncbi:hypothetical protein ZWY2020_029417 [Hordeum vulgare]|nr:hypothetical protein ZWY2020_029417 [Hordeum vulgare]
MHQILNTLAPASSRFIPAAGTPRPQPRRPRLRAPAPWPCPDIPRPATPNPAPLHPPLPLARRQRRRCSGHDFSPASLLMLARAACSKLRLPNTAPCGGFWLRRRGAEGSAVEAGQAEAARPLLRHGRAGSCPRSSGEHRHVGSANFNLLSSRSHTIFTLNLIDLAGSESSRAETNGVRRKEGSYINKSLLTLGTTSRGSLEPLIYARCIAAFS